MTDTLEFSTRVLGQTGAQQLRDRKVTQTIRSLKAGTKFLRLRGCQVYIALDGKVLYEARITEIQRKKLRDLSQWDADIMGFDSIHDLQSALKRAGFRFKALYEYEGFHLGFLPLRKLQT